jgi:hypothetical protein
MFIARFLVFLIICGGLFAQSADFRVIQRLKNLPKEHFDGKLQGIAHSDGSSRLVIQQGGVLSVRDVASDGEILRQRTLHFSITFSYQLKFLSLAQDKLLIIVDDQDSEGCSLTRLTAKLEVDLRVVVPGADLNCIQAGVLADDRIAIALAGTPEFELFSPDASSRQRIALALPSNAPADGFALRYAGEHLVFSERVPNGVWIGAFAATGALQWQQTLVSDQELEGFQLHVRGDGSLLFAGEFCGQNICQIRYSKISAQGQIMQPLSNGASIDRFSLDGITGELIESGLNLFVAAPTRSGDTELLNFRQGILVRRITFVGSARLARANSEHLLVGVKTSRPSPLRIETRSIADLSLLRQTSVDAFDSNGFALVGDRLFSLSSTIFTNASGTIEGEDVLQKLDATGAVEASIAADYESARPGNESFVQTPKALLHTRFDDNINVIWRINDRGKRHLIARSNEFGLAADAQGQWLSSAVQTRFVDNNGLERAVVAGGSIAARVLPSGAWLHQGARVIKVSDSGQILVQYAVPASNGARIEFLNDAGDYLQFRSPEPSKRYRADGSVQFARPFFGYAPIANSDDLLILGDGNQLQRVTTEGQIVWSRTWPYPDTTFAQLDQSARAGERLVVFWRLQTFAALWINEENGNTISAYTPVEPRILLLDDSQIQQSADGLPIIQVADSANNRKALKLDTTGVVGELTPPNYSERARYWQNSDGDSLVQYLGFDPEFGGFRWHTATNAFLENGFED